MHGEAGLLECTRISTRSDLDAVSRLEPHLRSLCTDKDKLKFTYLQLYVLFSVHISRRLAHGRGPGWILGGILG